MLARESTKRLEQLITLLAQGFEIEAPVLRRSMSEGDDEQAVIFDVVIRRGNELRVLALSQEQVVCRWLDDTNVPVLNI
ncbi:MAG: hypothetical protein NVS4B8_05920 [Herpetosiphon sp.]